MVDFQSAEAFHPQVNGSTVVAGPFLRRFVREALEDASAEGFLNPDEIPETSEKGSTTLTPAHAAMVALSADVIAEHTNNPARKASAEVRALRFGEAALQAGMVSQPPLAESDPELHFEPTDMTTSLRTKYPDL